MLQLAATHCSLLQLALDLSRPCCQSIKQQRQHVYEFATQELEDLAQDVIIKVDGDREQDQAARIDVCCTGGARKRQGSAWAHEVQTRRCGGVQQRAEWLARLSSSSAVRALCACECKGAPLVHTIDGEAFHP